MTYRVITIEAAKQRIRDEAAYIATEHDAPERAAAWLRGIFDVIDGLAEMPRRYQRATEDAWRDYEIRRFFVDNFVLFYTIVEETETVWVIHAKHVRQLTRRAAFPSSLDDLRGSEGDLLA